MKRIFHFVTLIVITGLMAACLPVESEQLLYSPNRAVSIGFHLRDGQAFYSVSKNGQAILNESVLGFALAAGDSLFAHFEIKNVYRRSFDETWQPVWGEETEIRNHFNEMTIELQEKSGLQRKLKVIFRAFDDGIGFRYEFPKQENLKKFEITDELTSFSFAGNYDAWTSHSFDRDYEQLYRKLKITEITDTINAPATFETGDGNYIFLHEANLTDYAAMNLYVPDSTVLKVDLTPWSNGTKVYAETPFVSPWRMLVLAGDLNQLANSHVMLNLNEPCKIEDVSWIKPAKYIGIWWGMHLKKMTWTEGAIHGATTANMLKYIDFAAEHRFNGVLVEGWNYGWDGYMVGNGEFFRFAQPYPDFDIEKISRYAAEKGVEIIGHNETSGAITNYENQLDSAFLFANQYGISAIKTGYVASLLDGKERHSSQYGIRHYRKVIETAAKYHVMIDNHEPAMPTGLQRTYPNLMTQEGVRGQEWDAWSADGGNPPEHTTIIPFTRGLAGPMDFTPGTFNFTNPAMPGTRVQTTLAKQLALYVVIYSPFQMASDLPEHYENQPAFEFIEIVPVDWAKSIVLDGKIGDFIVTARKDKHSDDWFVGAITDENARTLKVDFSFLEKGKKYTAKIFSDATGSDWKNNPYPVEIEEKEVDAASALELYLAPGGGAAIYLKNGV